MINVNHPDLSVRRQCALLGIARSGLYYDPKESSEENLLLMRLLDEQYTRTPFYGVRRMTHWLHELGCGVDEKRVRRLLRLMGLEAIYPKPKLSEGGPEHRKFPYLLRGLAIRRPNQVWAADITYLRLRHGFAYLVAIMDWYSRYVLSWDVSNTMEADFCAAVLEEALRLGPPEISNTDQGSQFTSEDYLGRLERAGVRISMDGRGRFLDNIMVERLWRTVKYEDIYLHEYETVSDARAGLSRYFPFYNGERYHKSLGYLTPAQVYRQGRGATAGMVY
jgi:putative transposase